MTQARRTNGGYVPKKNAAGEAVLYWKWRDSRGEQVMRKLGVAHLVPEGDRSASTSRAAWRVGPWVAPSTRTVPPGVLTRDEAQTMAAEVVAAHEAGLPLSPGDAEAARLRAKIAELEAQARALEGDRVATFAQAAEAWYAHRRDVKRVKPSTLADYRYVLDGRLLPELGDLPLVQVTTARLYAFRDGMTALTDEDGEPRLSPRTVNKHLIIVSGILRHATRPADAGGFGLAGNPADHVDKLGEETAEEVDPYTPGEVVAIAAAMARGAHRKPPRVAVGERKPGRATEEREATEGERAVRAVEDARDAAAVLVAGFCGLRRGEVCGLRHADVSHADGLLRVRRGWVGGQAVQTKGRKAREVPMPRQVADALGRLERARQALSAATGAPVPVGPEDYVLGNVLGEPMDGSALSKRFRKATDALGARRLKFHGLRHGYVTFAREGFGPDRVQRFAGHEDARTAQRYAHPKSMTTDADRMTALLAEALDEGREALEVPVPAAAG